MTSSIPSFTAKHKDRLLYVFEYGEMIYYVTLRPDGSISISNVDNGVFESIVSTVAHDIVCYNYASYKQVPNEESLF